MPVQHEKNFTASPGDFEDALLHALAGSVMKVLLFDIFVRFPVLKFLGFGFINMWK